MPQTNLQTINGVVNKNNSSKHLQVDGEVTSLQRKPILGVVILLHKMEATNREAINPPKTPAHGEAVEENKLTHGVAVEEINLIHGEAPEIKVL